MLKDYKQYYIITEIPEIVFKGLTLVETIQLWTDSNAEMELEQGGLFSLWDESIVGHNILIEEPTKIVQEWYFGDETDAPSIVTIKLFNHKKGTSIQLEHTNIPEEFYENIVDGWDQQYFGSLMNFYS